MSTIYHRMIVMRYQQDDKSFFRMQWLFPPFRVLIPLTAVHNLMLALHQVAVLHPPPMHTACKATKGYRMAGDHAATPCAPPSYLFG